MSLVETFPPAVSTTWRAYYQRRELDFAWLVTEYPDLPLETLEAHEVGLVHTGTGEPYSNAPVHVLAALQRQVTSLMTAVDEFAATLAPPPPPAADDLQVLIQYYETLHAMTRVLLERLRPVAKLVPEEIAGAVSGTFVSTRQLLSCYHQLWAYYYPNREVKTVLVTRATVQAAHARLAHRRADPTPPPVTSVWTQQS